MTDSFLIVDIGSGYTRCGFSGESTPRLIFPSIIESGGGDDLLFGNDAYKNCRNGSTRDILNKAGVFDSWDDFTSEMEYIFKEVGVEAKETSVFMIEKSFQPKNVRERVVEILFEKFKIPSFMFENEHVCTLFTTTESTAVICSMGENFFRTCPIYEGYTLQSSSHIFEEVGGRFVRNELSKVIFKEKGTELLPHIPLHNEILDDILRKYCYVELPTTSRRKNIDTVHYKLPCGNILELNETILTQPISNLLRKEVTKNLWWSYGEPEVFEIVQSCLNSVRRSDVDIRQEMMKKIFLTGGLSQMEGMEEIVQAETYKGCGGQYGEVNVKRLSCPEYSAFLGASLLVSSEECSSYISSRVIDSEMYDAYGPNISHRSGTF